VTAPLGCARRGLQTSTNGAPTVGGPQRSATKPPILLNELEDEQAGGEVGAEDILNKVMESRGMQKDLSFFAFTATPKGKTLNLFGRMGPSGKPESFHTYSMRQAIEEGFILDVLKSYTTYKTYYGLVKAIEDNPKLP
jgi:hypothetical protein